MQLSEPYVVSGSVPVDVISKFIAALEDSDFFSDTRRQQMRNLNNTPSIVLRHSEGYIEELLGNTNHGKNTELSDFSLMSKYKPLLQPILDALSTRYNFSDYACVIAKLLPNTSVGRHKDAGPFLETCHRVHVPLVSTPDCIYEVDGTEWHMEVGKVYEIDNTRHHSCKNGNNPRIHLVINLYP